MAVTFSTFIAIFAIPDYQLLTTNFW